MHASPCSRSLATMVRARCVFPVPGRAVSSRELPARQWLIGSSTPFHLRCLGRSASMRGALPRLLKDLDDAIARDCVASGPSRPGEMPRVPPTPFNDDAWHSARREAILIAQSRSPWMLLFPSAEDDPRSVAMVYNSLTDETRPAQPGDRLYMRTNFPYKPFEVSEATERIVDNFMELYFNWHLVGSGLLDGEEEPWRRSSRARTWSGFVARRSNGLPWRRTAPARAPLTRCFSFARWTPRSSPGPTSLWGLSASPGVARGQSSTRSAGLAAMDEPICATTWGPPTSSTTGSAGQRTASRCWPAWPARQRATATSTRIAGSTRRP